MRVADIVIVAGILVIAVRRRAVGGVDRRVVVERFVDGVGIVGGCFVAGGVRRYAVVGELGVVGFVLRGVVVAGRDLPAG